MTKTVDFNKSLDVSRIKEDNTKGVETNQLFDRLCYLASEAGDSVDDDFREYYAELGVNRGEDIYLSTVEALKETDSDDFAHVTEYASIINYFGENPDSMDDYLTIDDYGQIAKIDSYEIDDLADALQNMIK